MHLKAADQVTPARPPAVGYPVDGIPGDAFKIALTECRSQSIGPTYNHVEVNPKGKLPWLQRWLILWLDKLGAIKRPWRQQTSREIVIERRSAYLMDQMLTALDDIYNRYGQTPTVCYIGSRTLRDVMRITDSVSGMDAMYWTEAIHRGGRIVNMRVNVVPWLDGMFFV